MPASPTGSRTSASSPPLYRTLANSLVASLLGLSAAPACADETVYLGELPVVLSASRLAQPLREAPGAVTVLDRDMIRASGARNLPDLLRWVPGFQVAAKQGHTPLTTYHGLSDDAPRRMLVRIDGRSAYSPYFVSGIEWHKITVDLDDIERIEVFRGTNAATYGSQAFMGVVNIVTRAAADTPRVRARVTQGGNGIRDRSASIGQQVGAAALRLTVGSEEDDGLANVHDSYRRRRADLRVDWQLASEHRLEAHAGAVRLDAGTGIADDPTNPPRELRSDSRFGQLRWRWQPGPDEELSLTYFHHAERLSDRFTLASVRDYLAAGLVRDRNLPPALADFLAAGFLVGIGIPAGDGSVHFDYANRIHRDDIEFEHTLAARRDLRVVWGAGYRQDRLHAPQLFARDDELYYNSRRLFGNFEWRATERWLFNGGIMAEDGNYSDILVAPRLAANYHLTPLHTIRASVSRANRRPTAFERHSDMRFREAVSGVLLQQSFQPSPAVRPERITASELGYLGEIAALDLSVDLRVFRERISRLARIEGQPSPLDPALDPDARQFFSDGRATLRGSELAVMWRPQRANWVGVNYTRLAVDADSGAPGDDRRDVEKIIELSVPRVSASVFAAWAPSRDWSLSVTRHYVGRTGWGTKNEAIAAPAYYRTDWRVARRFAAGPARAELALAVANGGDRHAEFDSRRPTPRQAYASLSVEF